MTDLANPLSGAERTVLGDCEQRIESGLKTFVEVGSALAMIRDNRLYRAEHETFEAYCQARWSLTPQHANRLVVAASVVKELEPMGSIPPPTNERQARELAAIPEPERADVWRETVERTDGKPTAAAIRETYERDLPDLGDVAAALDRYAPDPEPWRGWRTSYLGDIRTAYRVLSRQTAAEVVERADETCIEEFLRYVAELTRHAEEVRALRLARYGSNVVPMRSAQ